MGNADYPTERIADTSRRFRQLGLGYANLGALLMARGPPTTPTRDGPGPPPSPPMTGEAYATSARAAAHGPLRRLRPERR